MGTTAYGGKSRAYMGGATSRKSIEFQTATAVDKTLTEADNGTIILSGVATGETITLPAVTLKGFSCKFIVTLAFATTNWVLASAEGTNIFGTLLVDGGTLITASESQINFVTTASEIGDWVEILSDGTQWLINGVGDAAGSITVT